MRLFVNRNVDHVRAKNRANGPEVGHVFPYWTRAGVPIGFDLFDDDKDEAAPGMVVCHVFTNELYAVDVDGEVVPLGMRVPSNYSDGSRLGRFVEAVE